METKSLPHWESAVHPGGDKDEACARAGVAKIQERVTAAAQKRAG